MDVDKEKYYADFPVFKGLQNRLISWDSKDAISVGQQVRQVEPL